MTRPGFLTLLTIFTALPALAAIGDHKIACQPGDQAVIDGAMATARSELSMASGALANPSAPVLAKFQRWFGVTSANSVVDVKKMIDAASTTANFAGLWCPVFNSTEFAWGPGDLAGLHPNSRVDMFFAPDYFGLPASGQDSQASTVYHELFHLAGADHQPEVYTKSGVEALAKSNPSAARRHAQSLEYFVADIIHGIP